MKRINNSRGFKTLGLYIWYYSYLNKLNNQDFIDCNVLRSILIVNERKQFLGTLIKDKMLKNEKLNFRMMWLGRLYFAWRNS